MISADSRLPPHKLRCQTSSLSAKSTKERFAPKTSLDTSNKDCAAQKNAIHSEIEESIDGHSELLHESEMSQSLLETESFRQSDFNSVAKESSNFITIEKTVLDNMHMQIENKNKILRLIISELEHNHHQQPWALFAIEVIRSFGDV